MEGAQGFGRGFFGVLRVLYLSFSIPVLRHAPLYGVDHHLSSWFHAHLAPPFTALMLALTDSAGEWWIGAMVLAIASALIVRRRWYGLLTLLLTVPGGTLLGELIKDLVRRERPYHQSTLIDLSGYSFPSGHTIAATLLYGLAASFALLAVKSVRLRALAVAGAALIIILVGLSRIALGAHYLTDVLGAMVIGLAWLWLCLKMVKLLRGWQLQRAAAASKPVQAAKVENLETPGGPSTTTTGNGPAAAQQPSPARH
jgi:membrane-associated phospholipid phosphatase